MPHIDLYYAHRLDGKTPVEKTVEEMKKLKQEGKIKYIGLSECSSDSLRRACKVAHIDAVQIEYSPFSLDIESEQIGLLKTCRELGCAIVAYSPIGAYQSLQNVLGNVLILSTSRSRHAWRPDT